MEENDPLFISEALNTYVIERTKINLQLNLNYKYKFRRKSSSPIAVLNLGSLIRRKHQRVQYEVHLKNE